MGVQFTDWGGGKVIHTNDVAYRWRSGHRVHISVYLCIDGLYICKLLRRIQLNIQDEIPLEL